MVRLSRILLRLWVIARVLARHNALFLMERVGVAAPVVAAARLFVNRHAPGRPGQRLARALAELGPTAIKFGQALSIRSDLLGEDVASDLSELQDQLPPFPFAEARRIVESELDQPLESLFTEFSETPVAAASIAQVHFAITPPDAAHPKGRKVAVKILRPGVEAAFRRDIAVLYWLAEIAEAAQPSLRRLKPVETIRMFEDSVNMEMDLRFEAAAAGEMAENFAGDTTFRVPEVDWGRTSQRVMTLERIVGVPVDEIDRLVAAGLDPLEVIRRAANAFFNMVFRDGFFHADMHPGNLFVEPNGTLVAVDFGIMGRIDEATRRYLGEMLLGFLNGEYRRVAEAHFVAGWVPADQSVEMFTQACRSIAEPIMGKPLAEISIARLLGQLFQVTETFQMEAQPQLLMLQKSMLVTEGVGRTVAPTVNMWELARPLIEDWMVRNLGPLGRLREHFETASQAAERLPRILEHADRAASLMGADGLRLHPDTLKAMRPRRNPLLQVLPWGLVIVLATLLFVK
ncbi:2-polyprenylphenol 6-hydroxylase [Roseospira marina]|uniref:2-polyprenylphenol 6-hydroxylase n=1 Tax=Roseospira marina TaxID=140057 RepID=A0A5M6IG91_9PROT|nr:2-polyprenylphenol 6-hydroxylase [Roseospira marina]KAA5607234.1 2-polyprenylphenol 6-hydroxylase [Roseospira marina]MBB4312614.1 ubiquinone biosynthesis protein [Roseospira marina]MBB5085370.1 ubiquinone biosynthesis protein [Roseospira marina]